MSPAPARLLTLDLDDTLWPLRETMLHAIRETSAMVAKEHPAAAEALVDMELMGRIRHKLLREEPALRADLGLLRLRGMERAFASLGMAPAQAKDLAQRAFDVFYVLRQQVEPYPEALPVLRDLRRDHVLGTLTNGNADASKMPVAELLAFSLQAASIGKSKPDPAMFEEALEIAGLPACAAVHLGDAPESDVVGARRAGYAHAIWFNPEGAPWPLDTSKPHHQAPLQVRSWPELPELLRSLDLGARGATLDAESPVPGAQDAPAEEVGAGRSGG